MGFPGETDEDFAQLMDFIDEARAGPRRRLFNNSPAAGARANELDGAVPESIKEEREAIFMARSADISAERLAAKVGTVQEVLIDEVGELGMIGRSHADAPEIDGKVYVNGADHANPGDMVQVEITGSDAYDLVGEALPDSDD